MGCRKLTYYQATELPELKKVSPKNELTLKYSSQKAQGEYLYGFNGMERDDDVRGSGNSYDFGARVYDPRVGRWFSVDPMAYKFCSFSPYNFAINNPTLLMDQGGKEPNKGQAGTWTNVKQAITNHFKSNPNTLESLRYTEGAQGGGDQVGPFGGPKGVRYLYTEKMGWIDLGHFMQVAAQLKSEIGTGVKQTGAQADFMLNDVAEGEFGYGGTKLWEKTFEVEEAQSGETKWSYEDAPSNYAGYDFFVNYYTGDETLVEDLERYFNDIGATSPETAPNWGVMQEGPQKERFFEQNKSFGPMQEPKLTDYGKKHQDDKKTKQYERDTKNSN